jgi:endonuclease/exonuclease/phosphatase family metal-dependent hydrolase
VIACAPLRRATATAPATAAPLTVLTWNMDAGRGDLARLLDDLAGGRLGGAPAREVVLLLQEAREADVAAIARARGMDLFFASVRVEGAGNAIVSTLPLLVPRTIALPRERQPRNAALAHVIVNGRILFVVSAHLENRVSWWRGGVTSDRARGRQAAALLQELPADIPGILGGDLNTWLGRGEPAWRRLAERFDDTPELRQPTYRDRLFLDHVFLDLPSGWTGETRVAGERYASNHHPVVGFVRF